jgi:hypothetical protein
MREEIKKQCYYKKSILDIIIKQLNFTIYTNLNQTIYYNNLC